MNARHLIPQLVAMGLANGILIGAAVVTSHPLYYLLVATGAGTFINLTWFLASRSRRAASESGVK